MIAPTWGCAVEVQEFEKDSRGRLSLHRGAVGVREQLGRFLTIPQSALLTGLGQSKVNFALGHRKRGTYAFAHLVPKKYY